MRFYVRAIHDTFISTRVAHALHRLAAIYLRLRGKRPPLEEMLSAWAGGRWHMGVYRKPAGERSAGR